MNEITRLLAAGYGVTFETWHDGRINCTLTTPVGDVTTALADTPHAALMEASPLPEQTIEAPVSVLAEFWQDGYRHGGEHVARIERLEAQASVMADMIEDIRAELLDTAEQLEKLEAWRARVVLAVPEPDGS